MGSDLDIVPEPKEVAEILGQLALGSVLTGSPNDELDALGHLELADHFSQPLTLFFVFDSSRDTSVLASRHKDKITAWKRNIGGEERSFGRCSFFYHLDHELLAQPEGILDTSAFAFAGWLLLIIVVMNLLQLKEAVFFSADVYKSCL